MSDPRDHRRSTPPDKLCAQRWLALALGVLAVTGLFVLKGKKGITGRGAWLSALGVVVPFVFLWLYL